MPEQSAPRPSPELEQKQADRRWRNAMNRNGAWCVYVASSWRNPHQQGVVAAIREQGYQVYDFRHSEPGNDGFHWSAIDPNWKGWTPLGCREGLVHPIAAQGFAIDFQAMQRADTFVLVEPAGRSAHLELGWAVGAGKKTAIMLADGEPERMYRLAGYLAIGLTDLMNWLEHA